MPSNCKGHPKLVLKSHEFLPNLHKVRDKPERSPYHRSNSLIFCNFILTKIIYKGLPMTDEDSRDDLIIRIAGEGGEGIISAGDFITHACERDGLEV